MHRLGSNLTNECRQVEGVLVKAELAIAPPGLRIAVTEADRDNDPDLALETLLWATELDLIKPMDDLAGAGAVSSTIVLNFFICWCISSCNL